VVHAGKALKLTARVPSTDATVTFVTQKLKAGSWKTVRTSSIDVTASLITTSPIRIRIVPHPKRGYWRYRLRSVTASGTAQSTYVPVHSVGKKYVSLTFDDGPWPMWTSDVLGALKKRDVRATFFMCGYALKPRPKLGKRVVAMGNEVGNHSWSHADFTRLSSAGVRSELSRTQKLIKRVLKVKPVYFRPPYGATNSSVKAVGRSLHLGQVLWSADTLDWKLKSQSAVIANAIRNVHSRSIILMHDGGGNRSTGVGALPTIIRKLKAKGYDFVTMSERRKLAK